MAKRRWKIDEIKSVVAGENPFYQSGYTPAYKKRKVGDEWTDAKGTWKKTKNGIVSVNKQMDGIRELVRPRCSVCQMDINLFGDKVDQKIFSKTGKCFQCLDIDESTLRVTGQYAVYENDKMLKNKLSTLKEFKKNVEESIAYLEKDDAKIEFVCPTGDIVRWVGAQNNRLLEEAKQDLALATKEIVELEKVLFLGKQSSNSLAAKS